MNRIIVIGAAVLGLSLGSGQGAWAAQTPSSEPARSDPHA